MILRLAAGDTIAQIAVDTGRAYETVRTHCERLRDKLHVRRNAGVVGRALAVGVISLDELREALR